MAACITVRPVEEPADLAFLFEVYASTRVEELAVTGWSPADIEAFLRMQLSAQNAYYRDHYPDAELQIKSSWQPIGPTLAHN